FKQFFITTHGDARSHQGVHRVPCHIHGADAMQAPAPVDDAGTVLHQVDRSSDVGGDATVGAAVDDHIEPRPGTVQGPEKAASAAVFPVSGKDAGDRGAVPGRNL